MADTASHPVLYLLGSAAPPVLGVGPVIGRARAAGWDVVLGLTPTAASWLGGEVARLEALTGHLVKSRYRRPGEPDVLPPADAVLFAPATFNSVNCLALGLTSSWVAGYTAEAVGKGLPVCVVPCVNPALAGHPQYGRSVAALRGAGVDVLLDADRPGVDDRGDEGPPDFPWDAALARLGRASALRAAGPDLG
ncbi:flavoprotein [Kitasatospora sp. NPDC059571]|uniref:flavoprotein n=1 Tax=Kitasatospora sp. NPDC059571 TaxID=3346871 RepID=UPI00367E9F49